MQSSPFHIKKHNIDGVVKDFRFPTDFRVSVGFTVPPPPEPVNGGSGLHSEETTNLQLEDDERLARQLQEEFFLEQHRDDPVPSGQDFKPPTTERTAEFPPSSSVAQQEPFSLENEFAINQFAADDAYARQLQQEFYDEVATSPSRYGSSGILVAKIRTLPTSVYRRPSMSGGKKGDDRECQVCRMPLEEGDAIRTLPCFHFYHIECIDSWLVHKAVCPVCQTRADQLPEQ